MSEFIWVIGQAAWWLGFNKLSTKLMLYAVKLKKNNLTKGEE